MNDGNESPREWGPSRIKIEPELTSVKVQLTDAEVLRRARMAGEARRKSADLEDEKKRVVSGYKARIEQANATAVQYEQHVQDGYYTELTECPADLVKSGDARHGWMVEIMHPTTGDVVSTRDPSPAELSMAREPRLPLTSPQAELDLDGEADDETDEAEPASAPTTEAPAALEGAERLALADRLADDVKAGRTSRVDAVASFLTRFGELAAEDQSTGQRVYVGCVAGYRGSLMGASEETLAAELRLFTGKAAQKQGRARLITQLDALAVAQAEGPREAEAPAPAVDAVSLLAEVEAKRLSRDEAVEALLEMHGGSAGYLAVVDAMATADDLRLHLRLVSGQVSVSDDKRRLRTLVKNALTERARAEG